MGAADRAGQPARDAWGDDIPPERQAWLEERLQAWEREADHGGRKGPFDATGLSDEEGTRVTLTGADVFWLAARTLAGTDEAHAVAEQVERLHRARDDWELQRILNLDSLHLEGARLDVAHLERATLTNAHLDGASLRHAHLDLALLYAAHLGHADLSHAILRRANFDQAILSQSTLAEADASPADLMWADMSGADLRRANLRGSSIEHTVLRGALLRQANLHRTNLLEADLSGVHLGSAHLDLSTRLGTLMPLSSGGRQVFVFLVRMLVLFYLLVWILALAILLVRGQFTFHLLQSLTVGVLLVFASNVLLLAALAALVEVLVRVGERRRRHHNRAQGA